MSAKHHAEWLNLVEPSGPFLSIPVLLRTWPQGLDPADSSRTAMLRDAFEDWEARSTDRASGNAAQMAWVRWVLEDGLSLPKELLIEGQALPAQLEAKVGTPSRSLRPTMALLAPPDRADSAKIRLLITVHEPTQRLDKQLRDHVGVLTPAGAMPELLRATGVRLGLVTNGSEWLLVNAPRGEATSYARWLSHLWLEEPLTWRAFRQLLETRRFFGVPPDQTLEALLDESAKNQQEVTDQLGYQVRRAVEVFVRAIDHIDREAKGTLLRGVSDKEVYEAALSVMMRLVFLFCAEERGLLRLGEPLWDDNYAVSTLARQLREAADRQGEEVLERRRDAWARLLATFRAVHGGIEHDRLRLPAYGGSLFNPDRFPFLEGRAKGELSRDTSAPSISIDNRTVLHLLESLQLLEVRAGGATERRRLSFKGLDIEQIGHVYEGLLDHTAVRVPDAEAVVLGLAGGKDKEPEIPLSKLEELSAKGRDALIEHLIEETGRSKAAIAKALDAASAPTFEDRRYLVELMHDRDVWGRVRPWASLLRDDSFARPVLLTKGTLYVARGSDRRQTGTHYTPRTLTESIVEHTLDPLVYDGPADGEPKEHWRLKSAAEILKLRVCDMAMGSAAFLVQSARYLATRLVEAWLAAERSHPGEVVVTPEGQLSTGRPAECVIPSDSEERLLVAMRLIADRCLYGVDKNPMAVEMGKLSLWLATMEKNRPFSFLDHALRSGDSLLGIADPEQLFWFHVDPDRGRKIHSQAGSHWGDGGGIQRTLPEALRHAADLRRQLESFPVLEPRHVEEKGRLLAQARALTDDLQICADLLLGSVLKHRGKVGEALDVELREHGRYATALFDDGVAPERRTQLRAELRRFADEALETGNPNRAERRRPFHWLIEFPEVFFHADESRRGFDAVVGNPPFLGGKRISDPLGDEYREYLVEQVGCGRRGNADLCSYFFLRAGEIVRSRGIFGLIATNTIAQGDTREVGLDQLLDRGNTIIRAVPSIPWPGTASLDVAHVWSYRGQWQGQCVLSDRSALGISAMLGEGSSLRGRPHRLRSNKRRSFQGSNVLGMGFVLGSNEALGLIERDARNREVVFPYLNGEDLNSRFDQTPSRWVINFHDWPLERAQSFTDVFAIVEARVKPERLLLGTKSDSAAKGYARHWWQYASKGLELYAAIVNAKRILALARVSPTCAISWVAADYVYSDKLVLFPAESDSEFSVMESAIHWIWAVEYTSTLGAVTLNYSPTDCFDTFAMPARWPLSLASIGEAYHAARKRRMFAAQEGLTTTYNKLHDCDESHANIKALRDLHVELDCAVAAAYGWDDLRLDHGFHDTKQGERFTVSNDARKELLARLLALNHQRYADEVAQGLHDKAKKKTKAKIAPAVTGSSSSGDTKPDGGPDRSQQGLFGAR